MDAEFSPVERANFVAAKVLAHATGFLDGRHDADRLRHNANQAMGELIAVSNDPGAKPIVDAARLLTVAMINAAGVTDPARLDRWRDVMAALVDLVKMESRALRESGAQRS